MIKLLPFCLTLALSVGSHPVAFGQTGCTDPLANNYSSSATINSGCTYNTTYYTPITKVNPLNNQITESSGLQWANGSLWTFNDGGGAAALYRIDTITNTILQTVNLENATNVDWEDITFDGTNFYIGDFGNNATFSRTNFHIYKFPITLIPDPSTQASVTIPASQIGIFNFTFQGQTQPPVPGDPNNRKFDCEAMIVDEGMIHLFSKNWVDSSTTHYIINSLEPGLYEATSAETMPAGFLVTAADKVEGKNIVLLLGYQVTPESQGQHYLTMLTNYSGTAYFSGNRRKFILPNGLVMGQSEGLTFRNSSYGYISNERVSYGGLTVQGKLQAFNIGAYLPPTVLALELYDFKVADENGRHKITWQFVEPVEHVQLQASTNGRNFDNVQTFRQNQKTTTWQVPAQAETWYRLAWQNKSIELQYSNVVKMQSREKHGLHNLTLDKNGMFRFTLGGANTKRIAFRLVNTEGKTVATVPSKLISPGTQILQLKGLSGAMGIVYVTALVDGEHSTFSLLTTQ